MTLDLPPGVAQTALVMAQERRLESARADRLFDDPFAGTLLDATEAPLTGDASLGDFSPPLAGYTAFRTRYLDDRVRDAVAQGVRQVVLLAAGLDTRAYRLAWPEGTRLYELDLPGVLEFKRTVLASARPGCHRVPISVDLRDDWTAPLAGAGHRADEPTAWIVEGLLMYLTDADAARLVGRARDRSASGSRLMLDHAYPAALDNTAFAGGRDRLSGNGSPIASAVTEPEAWLAGHGWAAHVPDPAILARAYDRATPPALSVRPPEFPIFWFADATA